MAKLVVETIENTQLETGRLTSPFGTEFVGVRITIGEVTDPATIKRTYEDIDEIFKSNPDSFTVKEERDEKGRFKSFVVEA